MKVVQASIKLVQGGNSLIFNPTLYTDSINELVQTISGSIIDFAIKCKKFKVNLGGFSFSRKFEIVLSIDGTETDFGKIYGTNVKAQFTLKVIEGKTVLLDKENLFIDHVRQLVNQIDYMVEIENELQHID